MRLVLRHALFAAALVALLGACSAVTRVAYNNAAFAATWMVDDWFDLHDGQRDWVKERFGKFLAWHRASELPAYERLLHDAAARAATGITEEDARRIYAQMRFAYQRAIRQAIPDMADFLLRVSPEQLEYLERKFAESNEKVGRESIKGTPQERREARAKRYLERVEDWTGNLSAAQRDLVRSHVSAIDDFTVEWLADRRYRQAQTLALARDRPSREALIAGLSRILLDSDSWRRPDYVAKLKVRDEQVFAMVAALDRTLTPEQRGKLHRRIAAWAADVGVLAAAAD